MPTSVDSKKLRSAVVYTRSFLIKTENRLGVFYYEEAELHADE